MGRGRFLFYYFKMRRDNMVITDYLERNARLYGGETALVEINP